MPDLAEVAAPRVNAPKQARSLETLDRFLDAIESLLVEREYDEITVADIVSRADRTVGSFYARFGDKDAALLAVAERAWRRDRVYLERFLHPKQWIGEPLEVVLRAGIRSMLGAYRSSGLPLKSTVMKAASDPGFQSHQRRMFDELLALCLRITLAKRDEIDHPNPQRAIEQGFRHVAAVCDHLLLFGTYWQADDVPDRVIVEDLVDFQMRVFRDGADPAGEQRRSPHARRGRSSEPTRLVDEGVDRIVDVDAGHLAELADDHEELTGDGRELMSESHPFGVMTQPDRQERISRS